MWNAFKEPLMILLFQPPMAEEAKETAGPGWRQSVLPIFGKKHSMRSSSGWSHLNLPMDVPLVGLLPAEPQNYVSWIRAYKRHPHAAFSDPTCSGFRRFCISPTVQVLKIFHLSYVTTSAAIASPGPSPAFFFSSLSHPHHSYIWPQLPAVIFFFWGFFSSSFRTA